MGSEAPCPEPPRPGEKVAVEAGGRRLLLLVETEACPDEGEEVVEDVEQTGFGDAVVLEGTAPGSRAYLVLCGRVYRAKLLQASRA